MPNNGFAAAPFVANFFKVTKLAIASFDVIVGSYFSPLVERLFEIDQKLVHVWLAENFQRFCERGYLAILCVRRIRRHICQALLGLRILSTEFDFEESKTHRRELFCSQSPTLPQFD